MKKNIYTHLNKTLTIEYINEINLNKKVINLFI